MQGLTTHLSEDDSVLLSSICQTISDLSVEQVRDCMKPLGVNLARCTTYVATFFFQVEDPDHVFDFRGLRLDWTRLQTYISCRGASTVGAGGKATGQLEAFR